MSSPDTGRVGIVACSTPLDPFSIRVYVRLHPLKVVVQIHPYLMRRIFFTDARTVVVCKQHVVFVPLHFLLEAVDLPMREAPILDWLAMTLPPLAVLGLVL